jgi:PP-loop superfamily ATP-utilizing enzyme
MEISQDPNWGRSIKEKKCLLCLCVYFNSLTHKTGSGTNASDLFESRPEYQISLMLFIMVFLSPSRQILRQYRKICKDRFIGYPF